jgi:hypothetical protein
MTGAELGGEAAEADGVGGSLDIMRQEFILEVKRRPQA